jgi:hypothetical protein
VGIVAAEEDVSVPGDCGGKPEVVAGITDPIRSRSSVRGIVNVSSVVMEMPPFLLGPYFPLLISLRRRDLCHEPNSKLFPLPESVFNSVPEDGIISPSPENHVHLALDEFSIAFLQERPIRREKDSMATILSLDVGYKVKKPWIEERLPK